MARAARLRRSRDIATVRSEGRTLRRDGFSLRARPGTDGARLAVTAPRTIGGAVLRNRARRRVREAFQRALSERAASVDLLVTARRDALALPFGRLVADAGSCLAEVVR